MSFMHAESAAGRWYAFTFDEQMGNIGSEVHRAITAKESGNTRRFDAAIDRALELFDLTLADRRRPFPQKKEIARAREVFCEAMLGSGATHEELDSFQRYFDWFAYAARKIR